MKGKRKMGIFLAILCLVLGSQPARAQEGSTVITVTVPEQPEEELAAPAGAGTLGEIPLPEGWEWKNGSVPLRPGERVTGEAVYRDKAGNILAEREILVTVPERENTKYEPVSGGDSVWDGEGENGYVEASFTVKKPEAETEKKKGVTDPPSEGGQSAGVKTGDETNLIGWGAAALLSLAFAAVCVVTKRKPKLPTK